jgi:hypothetical protein
LCLVLYYSRSNPNFKADGWPSLGSDDSMSQQCPAGVMAFKQSLAVLKHGSEADHEMLLSEFFT